MKLKYDEKGLIPAIVQDAKTGQVLMLAYMNSESLEKTLETKTTWFYSRSRGELWNKGYTSDHYQDVVSVAADCDFDTLLVRVHPRGPACHTGEVSCFYNGILDDPDPLDRGILYGEFERILDRRANPIEGSYTNYLFEKGVDKICKKIGEESAETIIAAKNDDKKELIAESADLLYHLNVLWANQGVHPDDVMAEVAKRYKEQKRKEK